MTDDNDSMKLGLEIAAIGSRLWFMLGIRAAFIEDAAMRPFCDEARRHFFWNNPANTLAYMGLNALEESCIINICESIQREFPSMIGQVPFRRAADLLAHRTWISHPGRSQWQKPWMREFHRETRQYLDLRAGIIWDLQKSIDELTPDGKLATMRAELAVSLEMVTTLAQIWQF